MQQNIYQIINIIYYGIGIIINNYLVYPKKLVNVQRSPLDYS